MKKIVLIAALMGGAFAMPASAGETEEFCIDFVTDNDMGGTEPCSCVGDVGDGNSDVKDAILALTAPADVDAMDQSIKDELAHCFPESEGEAAG